MSRNKWGMSIGVAISFIMSGCLVSCSGGNQQANIALAHQAYVQQDYALAYRTLLKAVRSGDAKSEYALGFLYYKGLGAPYDPILARQWIGKAARKNYPPAVRALEMMDRDRINPFAGFKKQSTPPSPVLTKEQHSDAQTASDQSSASDHPSVSDHPSASESSIDSHKKLNAKATLPKPDHSHTDK